MKVFLSSTAEDLTEYRQVADETIRRLDMDAVAMEFFGPLPGTPVEECERLARECDVLICIVAHRYGYVPEKGRGSITRREVEAAHNARKDVLVWIVADDYPWTEKKEQDLLADPSVLADPKRVAEVAEGVACLLEFKTWLRTTFTPDTFKASDDLGKRIAIALVSYVKGHSAPTIPKDRISIAHLPTTGFELFGREKELQILDEAWANPNTTIVSFVAWGGVGKTALVNHWLKRRMVRDNYRGADRVYAWSFFSQGTSERATSADLFVDRALRWFGDADPTSGSPWDKGERLAGYIRQSRTLLVLDGLEPLQHPPGPQEGHLKDAALQALLVELAAHQPGVCVISTRERVGDLVEFQGSTVIQHDLEHLSPQAGAQILRSFNVTGQAEELEEAAKELSGHAFSLTLLGSYLEEVLNGDIRRRNEIENLFEDSRYGNAAQSMIAAYEKWLGDGVELAILRLLGLFDRPADHLTIEVLREPPAIVGLTAPLQNSKRQEWNRAVGKLRRIELLAEASLDDPGMLDAHPLVREYFKNQLKRERPKAWREANSRLYEHLKHTTKELPDTIEEMLPLFRAVVHGCSADRHVEVLDEVFVRRMQRGQPPFSIMKLGAIGANLAVLPSFFESTWDRPVPNLSKGDKAFLLNATGFCLRGLGRLQEAGQPMQAALQLLVEEQHWESGANAASNLSQLYVVIGELQLALTAAEKSVELAHRKRGFWEVLSQVTLGFVLHQLGRFDQGAELIGAAEQLQKTRDPDYPLLNAFQGFVYNDLLLDLGCMQDVRKRAVQTLSWAKQDSHLLNIAFDHLAIGRALLLEAEETRNPKTLGAAGEYLDLAVTGFRRTGITSELPRGFLVRAAFHRSGRSYNLAERDLAQAYRIASRSGMGPYLADYHLETARLRLAQSHKDKVREHLSTAKEMIERMGYHRRDKEVKELEEQLG